MNRLCEALRRQRPMGPLNRARSENVMRTKTIGLAVALLLALSALPSGAGDVLTLDRAVEMALQGNLSLEAVRLDYESAKWGLRSARASLLPSAGLSSTARRVDEDTYRRANASLAFAEELGIEVEPFLYETTYETGFYVNVPIWNGGKLWGALGAANAGRDVARNAYESTRRAVIVDAKSAYFDMLRADALLGVQRDAASAAAENADAAGRRFQAGLSNRADILRWKAQLANEERKLVEAEGALTLARTRLLSVLGLPLDADPVLVDVPETLLNGAKANYDAALGAGELSEERSRELLSDNPDLLAMAAATRMGRSGVTVARGAFMPSLNASAGYGWKADDDIQPDDETAWSVTVALDVPIFTSFKNVSDYQSSKRSYLAAVRRQEDAERGLVAALRSADATIRSSLRRLSAARLEEEQAAELLKNISGMRAQGMATSTELVDAEVLHDLSRVGAVDALYDCLIAFAEAERLLGPPAMDNTGDGQ